MNYLFISEKKWEEFAAEITGGEYICNDREAMYGGLSVRGNSRAHTLCLLTMHLCHITDTDEVWNEFVHSNIICDEERHDIPCNDMKGKTNDTYRS